MDFSEALIELHRLQWLLCGHLEANRYTDAAVVGRELLDFTCAFGNPYEGPNASDAAWALRHLGDAYTGLGEPEAAEAAYRDAVDITTAVFGCENANDTLPSLLKLGRLLYARERFTEAVALLTRALNVYAKTGNSNAPQAVELRELIRSRGKSKGTLPSASDEELARQIADERHAAGLKVIEAYEADGTPYILYLRKYGPGSVHGPEKTVP